ncbi:unnamed protein product, partial [Mesorhabditis belari]|uniref:Uncharacterized protein n=1 Tax=Mesorhabditis belari TaxID=2138241 RepID=A0AAF3J1F0_9BILA
MKAALLKGSLGQQDEQLYEETEAFVRNAQEQLSRSFHELVSAESSIALNGHRLPQAFRRQKSAIELTGLSGKHTFLVESSYEAPLANRSFAVEPEFLRRKRFTRKAKKGIENSRSISQNTSIAAESSSSEEEPRLQQKSRLFSNSSNVLNVDFGEESLSTGTRNRQHLARGPAARRANRKQVQRAADREKFGEQKKGASRSGLYEKRSMSVRDLNGLEVDFSTQENVTRWASQILAELESLPSSRVDLTQCGIEDESGGCGGEDSKKRLHPSRVSNNSYKSGISLSPGTTPPAKRHTILISPINYDGGENLLNNNRAMSISEMCLPTVPTPFLQNSLHRLSMSLQSHNEANDSSNECTPRASPFQRSMEKLKDESRLRSDTAETLKASEDISTTFDLSQPFNTAEAKVIVKEQELKNKGPTNFIPVIVPRRRLENGLGSNTQISERFRRLSPQRSPKGPEEVFPRANGELMAEKNRSGKNPRSPIHEKIARRKDPEFMARAQRHEGQSLISTNDDQSNLIPQTDIHPPVPAPRKSIPTRIADWEQKCKDLPQINKIGNIDRLAETDARLQNSIAKLSQVVYGNIQEEMNKDRQNGQSSLPIIETTLCNGDDQLEKWKKQAECRNRQAMGKGGKSERSVNRVISSLIEAAEESSRNSSDRPQSLEVISALSPAQDVSTQTSPFSLSRSSSFDWINSPTENTVSLLSTPQQINKSENPADPSTTLCRSDSSEDTDCDAEVQEMTRAAHGIHEALDESLALLLQCTKENDTQGIHRPPPPLPYTKSAEESPMSSRRLKVTTTSIITRNENQNPTWKGSNRCGSGPIGMAGMSDSIYDNVPGRKTRKFPEPNIVRLSAIENESSLTALQQVSEAIGNLTRNEQQKELSRNSLIGLSERAGSCEQLITGQQEELSETYKLRMEKLEGEARDCCEWLRRAGFPQYAKQFEDDKFPLDLKVVHADHCFLDLDSLHALNRRLSTLNRAAIMRMDRVVLRPRNEIMQKYDGSPLYDDDIALSDRWRYQRQSQTWNRIGNEPIYGAGREVISTRPDRGTTGTRGLSVENNESRPPLSSRETRGLQRSQSERIKERARAFIKKMDIRSSSRRRKGRDGTDALVIGDPVLVSYDSASPESARMMKTAVPAGSSATSLPLNEGNRLLDAPSRGRASRRQGMVMLSPETPEPSIESPFHPSFMHTSSKETDSLDQLPTSSSRRDHSAPIPRLSDVQSTYFGDHHFPSRVNPHDAYLYPNQSRARSVARREEVPNGFSQRVEPSLSPYSQQYLSSSRGARQLRSQPTLHADGYFMHDISPNESLNRRVTSGLPRTTPINSSPCSSMGRSTKTVPKVSSHAHNNAHLHVAMSGESKMSQSSLDGCTDSEEHSIQSATVHPRRDSGVGSSLSRSPSGPSAQRVRASLMPIPVVTHSTILHQNGHPGGVVNNGGPSASGSWTSASSGVSRNGSRPPASSPLSASISSSLSNKEEDTFFVDEDLQRCIDALSLVDLSRIRKLAYLRVTALLEKRMAVSNVKMTSPPPSSGTAVKNWAVQKLMKKIKQIDGVVLKNREPDDAAFAVSLEQIYRKTGSCFPRSILEILRYLRLMSPETVGIFRKNGVRSRIQELRDIADVLTDKDVFVGDNRLRTSQVHDAADLLKQFLRELPEPLMTVKLSETFAQIFLYLPEHERLLAMQYAIVLLPDENREALQSLLFFLNDIARHSDQNNMNAQNLSVCFTPSLFHLSASRLNQISPTRRHKTIGAAGMPTEKEMKEQRAAQDCLTTMIVDCRKLFLVPDGCPVESNTYEEELPTLGHLGGCGYRSYLVRKFKDMLKDHQDRWKGFSFECSVEGIEVSSKKSPDGHPIRLMRAVTEVEAPPKEVLHRLLRERPVWDLSMVNWRLVDNLQPDTDIFQYVVNDTVGHPTRDCYVVRMQKPDMGEIRGACALIERSIICSETQMLGGVRAVVLDSRVLIEPHHGRSRVTFMQRVDYRGRGMLWYNRVYPVLVGRQVARLRDSFLKFPNDGPETKV